MQRSEESRGYDLSLCSDLHMKLMEAKAIDGSEAAEERISLYREGHKAVRPTDQSIH